MLISLKVLLILQDASLIKEIDIDVIAAEAREADSTGTVAKKQEGAISNGPTHLQGSLLKITKKAFIYMK